MEDKPATKIPSAGERTPNPVRRERTRNAILDVAEDQFVGNGFAATTIDQLAPLTNVSKGAVYFHFGSKEALLLALLERARDTVFRPALELLRDPEASPADRLVAYFHRIGTLQEPTRYLLPVLITVQTGGIGDAPLRLAAEIETDIRGHLTTVIEQGQRSGDFTSAQRPQELAAITMSLIEGMVLQWHRHAHLTNGPELLRAGRRALLGALR